MSDSDEVMSLTESVSVGNLSESSNSDEMDVVGIVRPYADEPLAMKKKTTPKVGKVNKRPGRSRWSYPCRSARTIRRRCFSERLVSTRIYFTNEKAKNFIVCLKLSLDDDFVRFDTPLFVGARVENGRFGTQMLQRNCTGSPKTYFLMEVNCITKHGDFSAMTNRTVLVLIKGGRRNSQGNK